MNMNIQQVINIVREAGTLMDRTGGFEVHDKGARENIVTSSDVAVQHFLTQKLSALLPGSGFLCEEEDLADTAHEAVWIIDPIDGTANYARGNENCCISVALARGGELAMGVVYCPWRGEMYAAEKDRGAYIRYDGRDLEGSEEDLIGNAKRIIEEGGPIPRIYHSTGSSDFLLDSAHFTRDFFTSFEGNPFDYIYEEDPGAHTWEYWDDHIQRFLAYIQK